ncbi:hypothetical protein NDU88_005194 [Pleurodeles waltl]|uniref:Uncharacterized protein n=1 Tax=Pleurodeles waltl TaxID=8319 RepID=A0AAV7UHF8_PLEWA|nr:hypothetical protein NDU88_005194 [Pleurodeles waltl]
MDDGLLPVRNPDIRVSKKMKRDEGSHMGRAVNAEEETDAGGRKASASMEKYVAASILPENEEEDADPNPCRTRDTKEDRAGDSEETRLRHVPGGAWLQQAEASDHVCSFDYLTEALMPLSTADAKSFLNSLSFDVLDDNMDVSENF